MSDHERGAARARGRRPGVEAREPSQIPAEGWKQILLRTKDELKEDRVGLMAAGVAFYAMLAIFPALIAAVTVWGLVSDPQQIQQTIAGFTAPLPEGAAVLLENQLSEIAGSSDSTLGWALAASLAGALWSASSGTKGLMNAISAAYDEGETRGFLRVRGLALLLTVGGVFFGLLVLGLIAVLPAVLTTLNLGSTLELVVGWARWPILAAALTGGLAVMYRAAPDRDEPEWSWLSWGAVAALAIWLLASVGFSWYVTNFGSFGETYGSIAGVIVLMLWFFLTAFAVLLGAELNAEMELQTNRDTTRGEPQPMGSRGAHVADAEPHGSN